MRYLIVVLLWLPLVGAKQPAISLEDAVALALKNSPSLKQSAATIEQARLDKAISLTSYLPKVDAQFSRLKNENEVYSAEFDQWSDTESIDNRLTFSVTETIDLQGKVARQYKRSDYKLKSAEAQHKFESSLLIKQVIDLYFTLLEARASVKGLKAKKARIEENRQLVDTEIALGRRSRSDAGEINHAAAKNEIDLLRSEQTIRSSLKSLGLLLYEDAAVPEIKSLDQSATPAFVTNWKSKIIPAAEQDVINAVGDRPDILSLDHNIRAANSARRETYWEFAPEVAFKADYTRDFSRYANDVDPDKADRRLSVGLVATWNLFDGGRDYLQMRKDSLARISDEYKYRDKFETAVIEIQDEREKLRNQDRLVLASAALLESAKQKYDSIKAQYQYGKVSTTDLLNAEVDYADAQIGWATEKFRFYKQYANLQHLSGRLYPLFK